MTSRAELVLTEALHARPANLIVRLASEFLAEVTLTARGRAVNARHILDVLALGAAPGDTLEIRAEGVDADLALARLRQLVETRFCGDLVPERGEGGAAGIGVGRAFVITATDEVGPSRRSTDEERTRVEAAGRLVEAELATLIRELPPVEAELFEPMIPILRELVRAVATALDEGQPADAVLREVTSAATTDLILDARARLLAALAGHDLFGALGAASDSVDRVVVTSSLLPSLVALAPRNVTGIVASRPEGAAGRAAHATSHASLLARGRGVPLAFVPEHVTDGITADEWLIVDATEDEARVWIQPSAALLDDARRRRRDRDVAGRAAAAPQGGTLEHLGVAVRVNIGSTSEAVPADAEGVGLVRTELLHTAWTHAPDERDVVLALSTIARAARGAPVVVRLYDAGGDKPLPWLPAPEDRPSARGFELLLRHHAILEAQVRAVARVRRDHDVRLLIPLARDEEDVHAVRALAGDVPLGAMIETSDAASRAASIAAAADFICIGTNDLTSSLGAEDAPKSARVLARVLDIVRGARERGRPVTVCGELAGDPEGARLLVGLGVTALSVAPPHLARVRSALQATTRSACEGEARRRLDGGV